MRNSSLSHTQLLSVNDVVRVRSSDSTEPVHLPSSSAAGKTMADVSSPARRPITTTTSSSSLLSPLSSATATTTAAPAMVTPGRPTSKVSTQLPTSDCSSPWRTKDLFSIFRPEPFGSRLAPSRRTTNNDTSSFPDLLSMGRSNAFDEDDAEF